MSSSETKKKCWQYLIYLWVNRNYISLQEIDQVKSLRSPTVERNETGSIFILNTNVNSQYIFASQNC